MKKTNYIAAILIACSSLAFSQTRVNVGGGYFGHTLSYPGIVLEAELEKMFSEKASIPVRADLGFYVHPRSQYGLFLDLNAGFRKYFNSGLFVEESIGAGILQAFLNSDDVYEVDDEGVVSEGSVRIPIDFMPSLTLGIGYNLTQGSGQQNLIWMRPKIFWQIPYKTQSAYNFALQVGFTHTIHSK
jgi:hypothetical protein